MNTALEAQPDMLVQFMHAIMFSAFLHALQVSTVLGSAIPEEREKNGWVEGVAIWIAVLVVIGVGE